MFSNPNGPQCIADIMAICPNKLKKVATKLQIVKAWIKMEQRERDKIILTHKIITKLKKRDETLDIMILKLEPQEREIVSKLIEKICYLTLKAQNAKNN